MYPMKLISPLKDYIWGGTKLITDYNKSTTNVKVAEAWELSCHKDGQSIVANGRYKGMTLQSFIDTNKESILGTNSLKFEYFPILIKLIDAKDNLSVQVHPDNEYALKNEGEYGKTEMWYIVDCEPDSHLLYGFDHTITKEEFARRIADNTLLEVTNKVPVKKGDVFFIEAGTLHAIGKGILIAEIQQNSNTTYRIYDYGRVGNDGKPRELHVDKALDVTELTPPAKGTGPQGSLEFFDGFSKQGLASCEYFTTSEITIQTTAKLIVDKTSFVHLLCIEGNLTFASENGDETLTKGESMFLPAGFGIFTLAGKGKVIYTKV